MNGKVILVLVVVIAAAVAGLYLVKNPADGVAPAEVVTESGTSTRPEVAAGSKTYAFAADSKIGFVGSKVTGSHTGGFTKFDGYFNTDGKTLVGADHKIEIEMASTFSDDEKLTGHLKSPDFFDVEKFPKSTFLLKEAAPAGEKDTYNMTGDFTLHGVTKTIRFPAVITQEGDQVRLAAKFSINRKDYGIVYPGMPDNLIRDEVVIDLNMVAAPKG